MSQSNRFVVAGLAIFVNFTGGLLLVAYSIGMYSLGFAILCCLALTAFWLPLYI